MRGFAERHGDAVAVLDDEERTVVARIVADVGLLLGGETFGLEQTLDVPEDLEDPFLYLRGLEESIREPSDPAILRLLPNAAPTDREVSDEFRRLTEGELRAGKVRRLRRVWEQLSAEGDEWVVPADEAMDAAAALTDVRLVLASRLGLLTDEDAERLHQEIELANDALEDEDPLPVDHERVWLGMLYQALSWLQETLVTFVVDREERDD